MSRLILLDNHSVEIKLKLVEELLTNLGLVLSATAQGSLCVIKDGKTYALENREDKLEHTQSLPRMLDEEVLVYYGQLPTAEARGSLHLKDYFMIECEVIIMIVAGDTVKVKGIQAFKGVVQYTDGSIAEVMIDGTMVTYPVSALVKLEQPPTLGVSISDSLITKDKFGG